MPRSALHLWSLHVQQHLHHETIEDLCTVVQVADFLADRGSLLAAGASLANLLLHDSTLHPQRVGEILDTLTENQALAILRAHAAAPSQFRAHYLKQPAVLLHHPQHQGDAFRPLYHLLTALPCSHERLAMLAHTSGIEGRASMHVALTEPSATLQAVRIAARHFPGVTSLSFRPWLQPDALRQALRCTCSLRDLRVLDMSGMHVTQHTSSALAGALMCLPQLQTLNLGGCGLRAGAGTAVFEALRGVGALERLVLRHNDLQRAAAHALAAQFAHLPHLRSLDVAYTHLSGAALREIVATVHHLSALRTLDVRGNPLHAAPPGTAGGGHQGAGGGAVIGGLTVQAAAHMLPLSIARSLACKLAALTHFDNLMLDQHRRITHAGHMHASAEPHPDPGIAAPGGVPSNEEPGVGLLTALYDMQPYMHAAYFHVDIDPAAGSSRYPVMRDAPHGGLPMHGAPLSYLTELQLHLVRLRGQGAALAGGLAGLCSLRRLRVTLAGTVADHELSSVVSALSTLQSLTLLKWHHEGGRGTAGYSGSFSEALWNLPELSTLEFDFALEDPRHAGVVGDAFRSLRKLTALHLGFCTQSLMSSLSPLLPATLQHMSVNAICERSGLASFCMHAPRLAALNSLSLAGQSCGDEDVRALAAYLPRLAALTMLYITLLRSSLTVAPAEYSAECGSEQHLPDDSMCSAQDGPAVARVRDGDSAMHGDHAWVWEETTMNGDQGRSSRGARASVHALEALARSIGQLPRLQSLRLGIDVWTEGMSDALFGTRGTHSTASGAPTAEPGPFRVEERLDTFGADTSMHGEGADDIEVPPNPHLAALTDVNFFLPLGPAFRLQQHRTDTLLPPCGLFTRTLCSCSQLESLEAEHFILTRAAVAPLHVLTLLPHLLVLDLQAMHMSVAVARRLARALHGLRLPCLTYLRLDVITACAPEPAGALRAHGNAMGADVAAANFSLVGDFADVSASDSEDSGAEDSGAPSHCRPHHHGLPQGEPAATEASGGHTSEDTNSYMHAQHTQRTTDSGQSATGVDAELAAILRLLPPLPSLVTLLLSSRCSDRVGWKAASRAWTAGDAAQRAQRAEHAEAFSHSLSAVLAESTRLQTLHVSTSQLPDSVLQAVGTLAGLAALTEVALSESACGAATAQALHAHLRHHTALSDVKLTGLRLKDPGARAVASWLRTLPALRDVTFDNIGLCPEGCVDLDRVITDLKATVRFRQQTITCVYGEQP